MSLKAPKNKFTEGTKTLYWVRGKQWEDVDGNIYVRENTTPSPVEGEKEELPDVIKFLLGESSFKSCWFGSESIPFGEKGRYWWRKHLRKYTEDQASRIKALEEQLAFEIKVANAQTEIAKELAQEKEALEERLALAEWDKMKKLKH